MGYRCPAAIFVSVQHAVGIILCAIKPPLIPCSLQTWVSTLMSSGCRNELITFDQRSDCVAIEKQKRLVLCGVLVGDVGIRVRPHVALVVATNDVVLDPVPRPCGARSIPRRYSHSMVQQR
jgi:hypothetical protein